MEREAAKHPLSPAGTKCDHVEKYMRGRGWPKAG